MRLRRGETVPALLPHRLAGLLWFEWVIICAVVAALATLSTLTLCGRSAASLRVRRSSRMLNAAI